AVARCRSGQSNPRPRRIPRRGRWTEYARCAGWNRSSPVSLSRRAARSPLAAASLESRGRPRGDRSGLDRSHAAHSMDRRGYPRPAPGGPRFHRFLPRIFARYYFARALRAPRGGDVSHPLPTLRQQILLRRDFCRVNRLATPDHRLGLCLVRSLGDRWPGRFDRFDSCGRGLCDAWLASWPGSVLRPGDGARDDRARSRAVAVGGLSSKFKIQRSKLDVMISQQLLLTIFLPLGGAIALLLGASVAREAARVIALAVALATLFCASQLVVGFVQGGGQEFAITDVAWLTGGGSGVDVRFSVGLDGLGVWLFGLSALLFVTAILVSWEAITDRAPLFYAMLLLLEFGCVGVFAARDIILFYVFFEFTLIPLFFLIGIWGSEERRHAAIKFFLFTLAGSLLTFLGLLAIVLWDYQNQGGQNN